MAKESNGVSVLVVDDDPAVRDALDRALRLEGYSVATVDGGYPALEYQDVHPAGAVVLDGRLPDLDGLEVSAFAGPG